MAGLQSLIEEILGSGTWVDAAVRHTNLTGTPLTSAAANQGGEALSDIYQLTFSTVVPGVSAKVFVAAASSSNPYNNAVGIDVLLDGATVYSKIIGGVDLVFSASGSFAGGWAAEVRLATYFGTLDAFPPDAGVGSDAVHVKVTNTGSDAAQSCKARLITLAKRFRKTGVVFSRVLPFAELATEKAVGDQVVPYVMAASSVAGSGVGKTMTLRMDGVLLNVINLSTSAATTSAGLNVVDYYRVVDGPLQDLTFKLNQATVNSDTENLLVFSPRFTQIAPDVSGAPGDWGISDVDLTETGQATGVITAAGSAYIWLRVLVPDGGNSSSNPYQADVCLSGRVTSGAGWAL